MSITKDVEAAFLIAFKSREQLTTEVLRMLKTSFKNKQIELLHELTDEEAMAVLKTEVKKRKESIEAFNAGERPELAAKEEAEIKILEKFLPAQLGEAEVREKVISILATLPEEDKANFGKAMGLVMKELKNLADGETVKRIVTESLQSEKQK